MFPKTKEIQVERREAALGRQAERAKRTPGEQLKLLNARRETLKAAGRPAESARERMKLLKQLADGNNVAPAAVEAKLQSQSKEEAKQGKGPREQDKKGRRNMERRAARNAKRAAQNSRG